MAIAKPTHKQPNEPQRKYDMRELPTDITRDDKYIYFQCQKLQAIEDKLGEILEALKDGKKK